MLSKPHNIIMNIDILMKKYLSYIAILLMGLTFPFAGQAQLFDESKNYFELSYNTLDLNLPDVTLELPPNETNITNSGKEYLEAKATGYTYTYGRRLSEKLTLDIFFSSFGTDLKTNTNTTDADESDAQVLWGAAGSNPVIVKGSYEYTAYGVGYRFYFPLRNSEYTTKWFFRPSFSIWSSTATFNYYEEETERGETTTQDDDGTVLDLQFGIQARINSWLDSGWTINHSKNNTGASVTLITKF